MPLNSKGETVKNETRLHRILAVLTTTTPKLNIYGTRSMLCIRWDQKGFVNYKLLKPDDFASIDLYNLQLIRLGRCAVRFEKSSLN